MKIFSADYVFPVCADPIKNGVVIVDDAGKVLLVTDRVPPEAANQPVERFEGALCPGFINTHCHTELSHLKDKIPKGTGLIDFIKFVLKIRGADNKDIEAAAIKADNEMYQNGIVAVGDISNNNITAGFKTKSKLYYHTFVEVLGFTPAKADEIFNNVLGILNNFHGQSCSITPHAPYTVSKELFKLIKKYADTHDNLLSIHNQECEDENKFYRYKLGAFNDLYAHLGIINLFLFIRKLIQIPKKSCFHTKGQYCLEYGSIAKHGTKNTINFRLVGLGKKWSKQGT